MTRGPAGAAVRFLDLRLAQADVADAIEQAWRTTTASAVYVGGPVVEDFEQRWADYCGVEHAVGVGNGTDALELVLTGLGVGAGDEVILPANTFIATAEAVVAVGAVPHFVDVDPLTLLATPEAVAAGMTPRTAAVIVVHLYGQVADVPSIAAVARARGVAVIEDAAQAHGGSWDGDRAGSLADAACFSFYPGKNLGALGDGGAVTTNDAALVRRIRSIADHGRVPGSKYLHGRIGRNSRLDALQAAVLSAKLPHLDRWNALRGAAHTQYAARLQGSPAVRVVHQDSRATSSHHLEVVRVAQRDDVRESLARAGVGTGIHYPVPCHHHAPYAAFPRTDLTAVEAAAGELLSLPMYPYLGEAQVGRVTAALQEATSPPRVRTAARVTRP